MTKGDGYSFFNISDQYILGRHKFGGIRDTDTIYYYKKKEDDFWHIIFSSSYLPSVESLSRIIRVFLSACVEYKGGLNLHASAVVLDKEKSLVIIGDKQAGKTTNMLSSLSCVEGIDFQSNDHLHIIPYNRNLYTIGSNKPTGVRIGTILMNEKLKGLLRDKAQKEELKLTSRGYGSRYLYKINNLEKKDESDNFTVFFMPGELAALFKKSIIPTGRLYALIKPKYDSSNDSYSIRRLNIDEKLDLVTGNLHRYYNGNEPYWNALLDNGKNNDPLVLDLIREIPGFEIISNEKSIINAWNELVSIYLRCGDD